MRRANGRRRTARVAGATAEPLERRTLMAAGAIDTTFGTAGFAAVPGPAGTAVGVAVDADGRTIEAHEVGVNGGYDIYVYRLLTSGAVDTGFGNDGLTVLSEPNATAARQTTKLFVTALPTGQILIAGYYLFRLNGVGGLDTTFAGGASGVELPVEATGCAVPANGNIFIAGQVLNAASQVVSSAVYEYTAAGVPDAAFGTGGKSPVVVPAAVVAVDFPGDPSIVVTPSIGGLAVDAQGRVFVSLARNYADDDGGLAVIRLTAAGAADLTFGTAGGFALAPLVTEAVTADAIGVAATTGVIDQSGTYRANAGVNSRAQLYAFSATGTARTPVLSVEHDVLTQATDLTVQPDGKVLLSGWAYDGAPVILSGGFVYADVVERFLPSVPGSTAFSTLDTTWGTAGVAVVAGYAVAPTNPGGGVPSAIALRNTGKVMFASQRPATQQGGVPYVARLLGDAATLAATGAINGTDYLDVNDDGVLDAGDAGLPGYGAFLDNNHDGVFDTGDVRTYSGAAGAYAFAGLTPGTYTVVQNTPAGYAHTQPTGSPAEYTVQVTAGGSVTANFGLRQTSGTISGTVFNDLNADGVQEAGEAGLPGFGVYLDLNDDGVRDAGDVQAIAGAGGAYSFTDLAAGTYDVRQNTPAGYIHTTAPFPVVVTVTAGSDAVVNIGDHQIAKKAGTEIGTAGSLNNSGNTIANAFDGNIQTFFDAPTASNAWVGLDFGAATTVSQVKFVPRFGYANRMVGGKIEASNSPTFGIGTVTAYTITTAPPQATTTTAVVLPVGSYRYWRYLGPNNAYCDIAELEFDG